MNYLADIVHYVRGEGVELVVFLHGFLGSRRNLNRLAVSLCRASPEVRILQCDLPGHGDSAPLEEDEDLNSMANKLWELVDRYAPTSGIKVLGHSLGGRVGLVMRAQRPERISHLMMLDISPSPITASQSSSQKILEIILSAPAWVERREDMRHILLEDLGDVALVEWLLMNLKEENAGFAWRIQRECLLQFHKRTSLLSLWDDVSHGSGNILCLKGDRSSYVSFSDQKKLESLDCKVQIIRDAGHFLHIDQPKEVLEQTIKFFTKTPT